MTAIADFMKKQGKKMKPAKEKKDLVKMSAKERNDLVDKMLKDFGYV